MLRRSLRRSRLILVALAISCWATRSLACPFCSALAPTISDDLNAASTGVVANLESSSEGVNGLWLHRLRVTEVAKGEAKLLGSVIEVATAEKQSGKASYWVLGYGEDSTEWGSPIPISPQSISYFRGLTDLPDSGPARLKYFLRFLRHTDQAVADDAYNEFAEATLQDIAALSDKLDRTWVVGQLRDPSVPAHRRRLCWTFLSQCGTANDTSLFDESRRRREADATFDPGMDAAISCFITLGGENALARVERDYLSNREANYLDCLAAVSAIRMHGTELEVIPRKRLASALHRVLNNPELADLVIPDLARWEDWSAIDRVVELFEKANEQTSFFKPKAVLYLKACPLPAAAEALDRLRAIDPEAVKKAEASMLFYGGPVAVPVPRPLTENDAQHR